jgi:hypothetical protein
MDVATDSARLEFGRAGERSTLRSQLSTPVLLLLIWLTGLSGFLLLYWGSKLTFLLDDWEFLLYRPGFTARAVLEPHGEHISIAPILIYKALLATVGMGSALPFRVVSTSIFLLSAILFFVLIQRRLGEWLALAATVLLLFVGAAWEDLLWDFQMGYFGSMAAGLGMLLALEREDGRGDRIACLLLTVSILFSSLGLPFVAAAAVAVLLRPGRLRRLYVFVIPLVVYGAWWVGWGHNAESALSASNIASTPSFVLDGIASSMASIFGLFGPGGAGLEWGRPFAVAAIVLAIWRIYRLGAVSSWFWTLLTLGGTFWILAGFNQALGRSPESSRYQYIGVIFTLLVAAELLRGARLSSRWLVAVFCVVAAVTASNINYLHAAWGSYRATSQLEKADLGALEIARDTVEPTFILSEDIADTGYVHVEAAPFLKARDEFGSPAYDPAELAEAPQPARVAADKVLFAALRARLESAPRSALPSAVPSPVDTHGEKPVDVPVGGCVSARGGKSAPAVFRLPPGGALLGAGEEPVEDLRLRRFSEGEFPVDLKEGVAPGHVVRMRIPRDRSGVPWKLEVDSAGVTTACAIG